jgi:hypothetical protein
MRIAQRIDNLVAVFSPEAAERRVVSRHNLNRIQALVQPGYNGGQDSRRRQTVMNSTAPEDRAVAGSYEQLVAAGMNLYRNDPLTKSIVSVVDTYMGESRPVARTSDNAWNKLATDFFNDYWWPLADARRRPGVDFGALQRLWDKYSWYGGDMLFSLYADNPRDVGSLYPYEGLQIRTPWKLSRDEGIVNGVRLQKAVPNRITHYYICKDSGYHNGQQEFSRIAQPNAIFAPARYWRPAMVRGVPELHAVIDALQDWNRTNDNVAGKIKFDSQIYTVERKGALGATPASKIITQNSTTGESVEYSGTDYGMRFKVNGDPKNDFSMDMASNPGSNHVPYMEYAAKVIAAGTDMPYEMAMHIFTNGSYTANRAARVDFKTMILDRHAHREKVLNRRVWNWVIARAMKRGQLPQAPINPDTGLSEWHKAVWSLPYFPQIDEGKEVKADKERWGVGQDSLEDWAREQGRSRAALLDAHDDDIREMQTRAAGLGVTLGEYMNGLFSATQAPQENNNGTTD